MNKHRFFQILEKGLSRLPESERTDILADYEEHFREAERCNRSEEDILRTLGNPVPLAKSHVIEYMIGRTGHTPTPGQRVNAFFAVLIAFCGLSLINFLVMIPLFFMAIGVLFLGWVLGAIPGIVGLSSLLGTLHLFPLMIDGVMISGVLPHLTAFFGGLGAIGLGALLCMLMWWITKAFFRFVINYIRITIAAINPLRQTSPNTSNL